MKRTTYSKQFCGTCDRELHLLPPTCDRKDCPCQDVCVVCDGKRVMGFPGAPCYMCKGTGLNPKWLRKPKDEHGEGN